MDSSTVTILEPGRLERHYLRELWQYRELFYFFAWRDILVRYKQTVLGIAWSIIRPLTTMIIFTVVFNKIAHLPSAIPYPILVFVAMLPWQFFANSFQDASNSLIGHASVVSKIYFPRLILPSSSVIVGLVDFCIAFLLAILLMFWYQFCPSWKSIFIPFFLLLAIMLSLGTGLIISALNVKYRDFRHVVPFIIQIGLYISPVGFRSDIVPEQWRIVYSLNPMVGVIDGFRWAILGGDHLFYWPSFCLSLFITTFLLVFGVHFFRSMERHFADII